MITTIDAAGRIVIPKAVRREAALEPGAAVDVRWREGIIEIEPEPVKVMFKKEAGLLVATPVEKIPRLRRSTVERTREALSTRRGRR